MKYKALSFLVVVTTTLSVVAMLLNSSVQNGVKVNEDMRVVENQNEKRQFSNPVGEKERGDKDTESETLKKDNNEDSITDTKNTGSNESEISNSIPKDQSFVVIDNRGIKDTNKSKDLQLEDYPDSTAVFKVESSTIEDNLSLVEKAKLLTVVAKISPLDYATISNYLYDDNSARGIINTFSLLKKRLSERDYEKVKDLASKYMDVNCIESYIN